MAVATSLRGTANGSHQEGLTEHTETRGKPRRDHASGRRASPVSRQPCRRCYSDFAFVSSSPESVPAARLSAATTTCTSCPEWDRLTQLVAASSAGQGRAAGDRVASLLPNVPQFAGCTTGSLRPAAVVVPIHLRHHRAPKAPELTHANLSSSVLHGCRDTAARGPDDGWSAGCPCSVCFGQTFLVGAVAVPRSWSATAMTK